MFLKSSVYSVFAISFALCFCMSVAVTACKSPDDEQDSDSHSDTVDGRVDGGGVDAGTTGVEALEEFIEAEMRGAGIPGLAAAIVAGGEVKWQEGFGAADIASNRPITTDTPFPIASISKTFIATALMQLVEAGEIDLDTDINELGLPFEVRHPAFADEEITLRMLTTHTSGILDNWDVYDCHYYIEADGSRLLNLLYPDACPNTPVPDLGSFLESYLTEEGALFDPELNFSDETTGGPGRFFSYSNVGAALAAYAIGTATETTLEEQCEAHIFKPLGMNNTHWHLSDFDDPSAVTSLHMVIDGELVTLPTYSITTWPDGGLRTTVEDLARYLAAIMNGGVLDGTRILAKEHVDEMLSPNTPADVPLFLGDNELDFQGIFWHGIMGVVGHTGGDPGVATAMLFQPDEEVGVVLLMNSDLTDMETFVALITGALELGAAL
jgi:CubicO group peptidase (beta-lactamase class C family)